MAFQVAKIIPNEPRSALGSAARAAAELANATAALCSSSVYTAGGITTATTTTAAKLVNTLTYTVGGKFFSKGATDNFWVLSGTVVQKSSWQKYLLLIDNTGAASVQEGTQSIVSAAAVGWSNVSALGPWAPLLKVLGSTKAIAGTLTIATDSSHTFTPGTTALTATGITATFQDGEDQSILPLMANGSGVVIGMGG